MEGIVLLAVVMIIAISLDALGSQGVGTLLLIFLIWFCTRGFIKFIKEELAEKRKE